MEQLRGLQDQKAAVLPVVEVAHAEGFDTLRNLQELKENCWMMVIHSEVLRLALPQDKVPLMDEMLVAGQVSGPSPDPQFQIP